MVRHRAVLAFALALPACRPGSPGEVQSVVIAPAPPAVDTAPPPPPPRSEPAAPPFELAMSWAHLCARVGGRVHCGKLEPADRPLTAEPPLGGIEDAVSLAAGRDFLCLATARGTVHCTGDNHFGQLGARLRAEKNDGLVQVAGIADARRVVAGSWHVCAILSTGRVACWGRNEQGQTGSAPAYAAEARELVAPAEVPGVSGVASLALAFGTTCAATAGHELWCWGQAKHADHQNLRGSQSEVPARIEALAGLSDLSAGESGMCGVRDGAIECWGDLFSLVPQEQARGPGAIKIPTPRPARRVRVANSHGCALLRDGEVVCFGAPYTGALGRATDGNAYQAQPAQLVEGLPRAIDVAVGASMSCAVTEGREVYCWGSFPGGHDRRVATPEKIRMSG